MSIKSTVPLLNLETLSEDFEPCEQLLTYKSSPKFKKAAKQFDTIKAHKATTATSSNKHAIRATDAISHNNTSSCTGTKQIFNSKFIQKGIGNRRQVQRAVRNEEKPNLLLEDLEIKTKSTSIRQTSNYRYQSLQDNLQPQQDNHQCQDGQTKSKPMPSRTGTNNNSPYSQSSPQTTSSLSSLLPHTNNTRLSVSKDDTPVPNSKHRIPTYWSDHSHNELPVPVGQLAGHASTTVQVVQTKAAVKIQRWFRQIKKCIKNQNSTINRFPSPVLFPSSSDAEYTGQKKDNGNEFDAEQFGKYNRLVHPLQKCEGDLSFDKVPVNVSQENHTRECNDLHPLVRFLNEMERDPEIWKEESQDIIKVEESISVTQPDQSIWYENTAKDLQSCSNINAVEAMASEVTNTITFLQQEIKESEKTIEYLKTSLNQQREWSLQETNNIRAEFETKYAEQKKENEKHIKKITAQLDEVTSEKCEITEKYEKLLTEKKTEEVHFCSKLQALEDCHKTELTKLKEINNAANHLRQEKWKHEHTKKIKEITIKGLQPEIEQLISKHETQLQKLRKKHQDEIQRKEEECNRKWMADIDVIKADLYQKFEDEKYNTQQREKERFQKLLNEEYARLQKNQEKWMSDKHLEISEEREKLKQQYMSLEKDKKKMEEQHASAMDSMLQNIERSKDLLEKKYNKEIDQIKAHVNQEKQAWQEQIILQQEKEINLREVEIRQELKNARDHEIELVIEKFEKESDALRMEMENSTDNRIKKINEKHLKELSELEKSEEVALQKYNAVKVHVAEYESEMKRLQVILKGKDKELEEIAKSMEAQAIKNRQEKEADLNNIHSRVRQAMMKKDETIKDLSERLNRKSNECQKLQSLLENQCKQVLKK